MPEQIDPRWLESKKITERLDADSWKLAELAYECRVAGHNMMKYADYIGRSPEYVTRLCRTWELYGDSDSRRDRLTFNDHLVLAHSEDPEALIERAEFEGIAISTARKHIAQDTQDEANYEAGYQAGADAGRHDRYRRTAKGGSDMDMALDNAKHGWSLLKTARKRAVTAFNEGTADPIQTRKWITMFNNIAGDAKSAAEEGWEYINADGRQKDEGQSATG